MIIEAKPFSLRNFKRVYLTLSFIFKFKFRKLVINECELLPNRSYLFLANHFSFWDGFWIAYLVFKVFRKYNLLKTIYVMVLKPQLEQNIWLRHCGCFSIEPGKISSLESMQYATRVLDTPGNVLLIFPQGKLESSHIRTIKIEKGLAYLMKNAKLPYQIIWCSNITEYFESINPTLYMNMYNLGPGENINFEDLKPRIDEFHQGCLDSLVRNK